MPGTLQAMARGHSVSNAQSRALRWPLICELIRISICVKARLPCGCASRQPLIDYAVVLLVRLCKVVVKKQLLAPVDVTEAVKHYVGHSSACKNLRPEVGLLL